MPMIKVPNIDFVHLDTAPLSERQAADQEIVQWAAEVLAEVVKKPNGLSEKKLNRYLYVITKFSLYMVFEGLTKNEDGKVKPSLAESWEISADGLEYTFHVRKGVTFTDGEPFNAQAVKLNMDAIVANIKRHQWLDMVNEIKDTVVVDEHTFKLVLKHPYYPTLVELGLTRPFRFISPKCFIDGATQNGVTGYVGTGPWILTKHENNQYATFTRNENYWGEKVKVATLNWKVMPDPQTILLALQKGEIDLLFGADGDQIDLDSYKKLEKEGNYKTYLTPPIASRVFCGLSLWEQPYRPSGLEFC